MFGQETDEERGRHCRGDSAPAGVTDPAGCSFVRIPRREGDHASGTTILIDTLQDAGALTPLLWLLALLIGAASVPGAFVAAAIARRIALRHHTLVLDAVVLLGGALLVARGIAGPS